ncbi:MAG: prepilin-type N-terminal cleavage/methylation domain-containing protein, partial [bacterium]
MNIIWTNKKGFTLIELIISIVLMGIIISTIALTYNQLLKGIVKNIQISKAIGLSKTEISIVNNTAYDDPALANGYNNTITDYLGSGYDLNRSVSYVSGNDASAESLKKVTVKVFPAGSTSALISSNIYLAKNVTIGKGSGGVVVP